MRTLEGAATPIPAWLQARYIALAAELERMHGAAFAVAFLRDIGIAPVDKSVGSVRCQGSHLEERAVTSCD
jgi:hypothetical protein